MKDEADRGIVDQSALGMRVATFSAGIWLTYVVCLTSAVYVAFTWGRPNRGLLLATFGLGMLVWVPVAIASTYIAYRDIFTEG